MRHKTATTDEEPIVLVLACVWQSLDSRAAMHDDYLFPGKEMSL